MRQIEKTRGVLESDCFVHIIEYVINNNNLYIISQQCQQSLREFIEAQFTFVAAKKNKVLL